MNRRSFLQSVLGLAVAVAVSTATRLGYPTLAKTPSLLPDFDPEIALVDSACLRIYAGAAPIDADAAIGAAVLLAEFPMRNATISAVPQRASASVLGLAAVAGTASFFRLVDRDGVALYQSKLELDTPVSEEQPIRIDMETRLL